MQPGRGQEPAIDEEQHPSRRTETPARRPTAHTQHGILELARSHADTLVVTGAHRPAGLAALGSVSERVAAHAHCSVLVLRDHA